MHPRYRTVQRSYEQPIIAILMPVFAAGVIVMFVLTTDLTQTWTPLLLAVGILLGFMWIPLTIEVTSEDVRVRLAGVGRAINLADIQSVEAREYSPMKQFGGWGWRMGRDGARAFSIAGNRAAVVTLADGREVYMGSKEPERVVEEIRSRLHAG